MVKSIFLYHTKTFAIIDPTRYTKENGGVPTVKNVIFFSPKTKRIARKTFYISKHQLHCKQQFFFLRQIVL